VVLSIGENADVDALARIVFELRSERGNGLKLVVREMQPCLRYADERLLLESGASLVAPANLPLARVLTLLETIQGQTWQGALPVPGGTEAGRGVAGARGGGRGAADPPAPAAGCRRYRHPGAVQAAGR